MRDEAVVDRHHVVRAVLAQAGQPSLVDARTAPGSASRGPSWSPGHRLDRHVHVEPGEPLQLLAHDRRLQRPLGRERDVLEVAAAARVRARERAGRGDPVGRRLEHLDGVGPQEPVALLRPR